jgi:hypothetical protein
MTNDDSFSNIAPATEEKVQGNRELAEKMDIDNLNIESANLKPEESKKALLDDHSIEKQASTPNQQVHDIDEIMKGLIEKHALPKGKMMYDPQGIHSMNP